MAAAALAGSHAHLILLAGEVSFADGWTDNSTREGTARAQRQHLLASGTKCHQGLPLLSPSPTLRSRGQGAQHGGGGTPRAAELWHCTKCPSRALAGQAGWGHHQKDATSPLPPYSSSIPATGFLPPSSAPFLLLPSSSIPHPAPRPQQSLLQVGCGMWGGGVAGSHRQDTPSPSSPQTAAGTLPPLCLAPQQGRSAAPQSLQKSLSCQGEWVLGAGAGCAAVSPRQRAWAETPIALTELPQPVERESREPAQSALPGSS